MAKQVADKRDAGDQKPKEKVATDQKPKEKVPSDQKPEKQVSSAQMAAIKQADWFLAQMNLVPH